MSIFIPTDKSVNKLKEKDCADFIPIDDGTLVGEPKYCDRSFICRQVGMKSDYVWYSGPALSNFNGSITRCMHENTYDYLCTGKYVKVDEKGLDEEVS